MEPFAAILFAHGTLGRNRNLSLGEVAVVSSANGRNSRHKGGQRAGVLADGQLHQLQGFVGAL